MSIAIIAIVLLIGGLPILWLISKAQDDEMQRTQQALTDQFYASLKKNDKE